MPTIRTLLLGLLLLVAFAPFIAIVIWNISGNAVLSVQTNSMSGTFSAGDALLVAKVAPFTMRRGDIVSYRSARNASVVVTHRVVAANGRQIILKGDRLEQNDPPVPIGRVVGRAVAIMPRIGTAIDFLHRPVGVLLALYVPAMAVIGLELRRLRHKLRRPAYSLPGRRSQSTSR